jgi:hypothetical protein
MARRLVAITVTLLAAYKLGIGAAAQPAARIEWLTAIGPQ